MENLGKVNGLPHPYFSFVSQLVITDPEFISEPVAANVSTVPNGNASLTAAFFTTKSHASPSYFAPAAINLVQSITLPPPTANRKSIPSFLQISTPLRAVVIRGFGSTPG